MAGGEFCGGKGVRLRRRPTTQSQSDGTRVADHESRASLCLGQLKDIFTNRLYIEVQHLSAGDGRTLREAQRLGEQLNIPLVATNNVHFLKPEEHLHHRAVNAIRTGGLLTTVVPPEITTAEAWFKPAAEMQRLFPDHPELLRATLEIAERCNLKLELGKLIFPEFPVPKGESPFSYLWKLSFEGAQKRYHPLRPEVLSRLTHELEVIDKLKLAPVFPAGVGHRGRSATDGGFRRWRAGRRRVRWSLIAWEFPACARCGGDCISSAS